MDTKPEKEQAQNKQDCEGKLQECERQKAEYLAGWQRARADFLNYKKEEMERIEELLGYAKEEFILRILPILDNFDIAQKEIPSNLKEDEHVKGLLQIQSQISDFLERQNVREIKAEGEKFDPGLHEITVEEEVKEAESGTIIEELQKGYIMDGRVLRPAKVKVVK